MKMSKPRAYIQEVEVGSFKLNDSHLLSVVAIFPHQGTLNLEFLFEVLWVED